MLSFVHQNENMSSNQTRVGLMKYKNNIQNLYTILKRTTKVPYCK